MINFGPLTTKLQARMLTYSKSTLGVLRMLMHLSLGHVTLPPGEFSSSEIFSQWDLRRRADSRWTLPQILVLFFFHTFLFISVVIVTYGIGDDFMANVLVASTAVTCRTSDCEVAGSTLGRHTALGKLFTQRTIDEAKYCSSRFCYFRKKLVTAE